MTTAEKIYKLNSNENHYGPSPKVVRAIQEAAGEVNFYPPRTDEGLRKALAEFFHADGLTPDNFFTANSGVGVIELIGRAYLREGDSFIICPPTFGAYKSLLKKTGATPVEVPLTADYKINIPAIVAAVTDKTRFVIVCNPNNPTANLTAVNNEMRELLDALPERVMVMADEVYFQFVDNEAFPNSFDYVLENRHIVIVHSFAKGFGMAGLRLGYGIAPPEIAAKFRQLQRPFYINAIGTAAILAALQDRGHLAEATDFALTGRRFIEKEMDRLGVHYWPSETNFLLFRTDLSSEDMTAEMLKRGVLVRPPKDPLLPNCVRMSVGTDEGNRAFVNALEEILEDRK